ncbi:MAG TPA: nicotinate-nicotinamide nucleotide adenylyltransferase [bacterium]|nr:nicotinate-nicotinamide nucleotide adenylyltransferase [bacterium]
MPKTSSRKKIALLGGKFDPPHLGHQLTIFLCLAKFGMDKVWLLPSAAHPFGHTMSPLALRLKMCRLLALPWRGTGKVRILDDERRVDRRPVYTLDLVRHLKARYGDHDHHLVIGEDNWNARAEWKEFDELSKIVTPLVIGRGEGSAFPIALPDLSSTAVRRAIADGAAWEHLVPAGVAEFVMRRGLYRPVA